jgi:hypothetical protein
MNRAFKLAAAITGFLILLSICPSAFGQADSRRTTVAITYPLDQTIEVTFRGTTRLPRLKGTAKVRRQGRRGTRVELNIDNMPRAYELGGVYTTYVLWAISPDGHVDNLGEIKRSGSGLIDSKIDVTTPLQTFALVVTAEPHFLVHSPSRMVVLENVAPVAIRDAQLETSRIQYIGNTSDYFRDSGVPTIAESDYRDIPVALLGARQAVNLARYAGAERDAPNELRTANAATGARDRHSGSASDQQRSQSRGYGAGAAGRARTTRRDRTPRSGRAERGRIRRHCQRGNLAFASRVGNGTSRA